MSGLQVVEAFLLGFVLACAASGFVWLRIRRQAPWGAALVAASIPICLYVALSLAVIKTTRGDLSIWATARLAPSVAFAQGHEVYSTSRHGAVETTMYPPMWVVSYLPVALGKTPAEVLRLGLIVTLLLSFLPVILLLATASPYPSTATLGAASFFLLSLMFDSLGQSLFQPHADAPALGFAMLACALILWKGSSSTRRLALVAALVWCSIYSKQVMVPLLVALPLWVLLAHGRSVALRFFGLLAVTGAGLGALLLAFFSPEGVYFNTIAIPSRVPWILSEYGRGVAALLVGSGLLVHAVPLLVVLTVGGVLSVVLRPRSSGRQTGLRLFLAVNPWCLPALVALAMVPVSVLGRTKMGGYVNTYSPTVYFLLAAGILSILCLPRFRDLGTVFDQTVLGLTALCALLLALGGAASLPRLADDPPLREHSSQTAYDFLIREDPRAYFPEHPLAHLLADGSDLHFASAIYDRAYLARIPLSTEQRERHFPARPSVVCWDALWPEEWVRATYLSEFDERVATPALGPGWECFRRDEPR